MDKKIIGIIILVIVILGLGIFIGKGPVEKLFMFRGGMAYIDVDKVQKAVMELPEYKEAKEKMEKEVEAQKTEFDKKSKNLSEAEKQKLRMKMESDLERTMIKTKNDLMSRGEKAVRMVARARKLHVVFDKGIVVIGVPDITDEVLKKMKEVGSDDGEEDYTPGQSNIAYFDRSIIYNLKIVEDGFLQLMEMEKKMAEDFQEKAANLSREEKMALAQQYDNALRQAGQRYQGRVEGVISEVVSKVAEEKNINLVLEKQSVVFGGTNITDDVIDAFIKTVSGGK